METQNDLNNHINRFDQLNELDNCDSYYINPIQTIIDEIFHIIDTSNLLRLNSSKQYVSEKV